MNRQVMQILIFVVGVIAMSMTIVGAHCDEISLASKGKSTFTIVIPSDAPTSVQDAATELQKDIQIATGAKLILQKDTVKAASPIISLSSTAQA